jgi:hypothetical protein
VHAPPLGRHTLPVCPAVLHESLTDVLPKRPGLGNQLIKLEIQDLQLIWCEQAR